MIIPPPIIWARTRRSTISSEEYQRLIREYDMIILTLVLTPLVGVLGFIALLLWVLP